ncbi:cell division protein CrgA [Nesterenkonia halobia]|uniref:Cell division protein CrgA n=1 Tax=Nesterenkonia halobia TaxID=37922 RepID=A0ABP6RBL2_9MICC
MPESKRRKDRGAAKRSRKDRGGLPQAEESMLSKASPLDDSDPITDGFDDLEEETLPLWYRITMFGLMILGLLWLIVWYISGTTLPIESIGAWNIAVGFGIAMIGFFMTMRWK